MNRSRTATAGTASGVMRVGRRILPPSARRSLRRHLRRLHERLTSARKRVRVEQLYTYSFPLNASAVNDVDHGYRLKEADEEALAALRKKHPRELSARKLSLLQARVTSPSEVCWLVVDDGGEVAGYSHVALVTTLNARINHRVVVEPHQAYFFDDYIFKRHRGKGLHAFSIAERIRLLSAAGRTEGLTTISKGNGASVVSYGKFGIEKRRWLVFLRSRGRTLSLPTLTGLLSALSGSRGGPH